MGGFGKADWSGSADTCRKKWEIRNCPCSCPRFQSRQDQQLLANSWNSVGEDAEKPLSAKTLSWAVFGRRPCPHPGTSPLAVQGLRLPVGHGGLLGRPADRLTMAEGQRLSPFTSQSRVV